MTNQDLNTDLAQRFAAEDSGLPADYIKEYWDVWPNRADYEARATARREAVAGWTPEEHQQAIGDMPV